ncbi:MAG: hypothetical protein TR69_WS6001000151 [candidate division WS6 bacterium OLB20]|uniref:Beta-propeller repeat protein n=1 Tax=candidate division WS6 bacterium OLB20 TaxID=1617426 RepID=A0A136M058_9BACT|nr:MAG: hypothetical protein TR69_WS6001000151 [candidate division WS6 bacterium OLB20]
MQHVTSKGTALVSRVRTLPRRAVYFSAALIAVFLVASAGILYSGIINAAPPALEKIDDYNSAGADNDFGDAIYDHGDGTFSTVAFSDTEFRIAHYEADGNLLAADTASTSAGSPPVPLAYVSSGSADKGTASSGSHLASTGTGEKRYLVVFLQYRATSPAGSAVDYNGTAMNRLCYDNNSDYGTELWVLANPDSGTNSIGFTMTGSTPDIRIGYVSAEGVEQSSPYRDFDCANGHSTNPTITVTSADGDLVIGANAQYSGGNSQSLDTVGATSNWINQLGGPNVLSSSARISATGASTNLSWTSTVSWHWSTAALSLKPDTGTGGGASETVTVDDTSNFGDSNTDYLSGSHTVSGLNRFMLTQISWQDNDSTSATVSYVDSYTGDYTSFSELCTTNNGKYYTSLWYLEDPAAAEHNIEVSFSNYVYAIDVRTTSFNGVSPDNPIDNYNCNAGSDTTPTVTVTSAEGKYTYGGAATNENNSLSLGAGMSGVNIGSNYGTLVSGATKVATPSTDFSWTLSGGGGGGTVYMLARSSADLYDIDPDTGSTNGTLSLYKSGGDVYGGTGLAVDPTDDSMYAILDTDTNSFVLSTIDYSTGEITEIGYLGDNFAGIAIDDNGIMYGVTGHGAVNPEEIYTIDKSTAATSFFMSLSSTGSGQGIAFNTSDGFLYRTGGEDSYDGLMDRINVNTASVAATYYPSGDYYDRFKALGYWGGSYDFLGFGTGYLYGVSDTGSVTEIGFNGYDNKKGIAVVQDSSTPWAAAAVSINPIESSPITVATSGNSYDSFSPVTYLSTNYMESTGGQRAAYITLQYEYDSPASSPVDTVEFYDDSTSETIAATFLCRSYEGNFVFEQYYVSDPALSDSVYAQASFSTGVDEAHIHMSILNGVDNSDPVGTGVCNNGTSIDPQVSVSTGSTNEFLMAGITAYRDSGSQVVYSGLDANEESQLSGDSIISAVESQTADAGSTLMEFDLNQSGDWAMGAVPFKNIEANVVPEGGLSGAYRIAGGRGAFIADSSGNFYAAANNTNSVTNRQFRISKHGTDASETWFFTKSIEEGDALNYANDLAVDSSGNVYIAADMDVSGINEGKIIKLDSSGAEVTTFDFEDTVSEGSGIWDIFIDGSDNIYACGYNKYDSSSQYQDMYVQKLTTSGTVTWDYNFSTTPKNTNESCRSLVKSGSDIYIWGMSSSGTAGASGLKRTLVRLDDASGSQQYAQVAGSEIDSSSYTADEVNLIASKGLLVLSGTELYAVSWNPGSGSSLFQFTAATGSLLESGLYSGSGIANPLITSVGVYEGYDGDTWVAVGGYDYDATEQGFIGLTNADEISMGVPGEHDTVGSNGTEVRVTGLVIDDNTIYASGYDMDGGNGADSYLGRFGWSVLTVTSSNNVFAKDRGLNLEDHKYMGGNEFTAQVRTSGGTTFAEVPFEFANDDISSMDLNGGYDAVSYKTYYEGESPATGAEYTLIVARDSGHNAVRICPDADSFVSIAESCVGEEILPDTDARVTNDGATFTVTGFEVDSAYGVASITVDASVDVTEFPIYDFDSGVDESRPTVKALNGHIIYASGNGAGQINLSKIRIYDNETIWERTFENPGGYVLFDQLKIELDSTGNIFVGADMAIPGEGNNHDYFLIKFDSNGNALWHKAYDGGSTAHDSFDLFQDMHVDSNGNAILTGILEVAWPTSPFWKQVAGTIKVNAQGIEVWRYVEDEGPQHSYSYDIISDSTGNIYVCGGADMDTTGPSYRDFYVSKIDNSTGNNVWTYRNATTTTGSFALENCEALQIGNGGSTIVAAGTIKAVSDNGTLRWFVAGLSTTTGALQWSDTDNFADNPGFAPIYTLASAYNSDSDRVLFAGRDLYSGPGDAFAKLYNPATGAKIWEKSINVTGNNDFFNSAATYSDFQGNPHYLVLGGYSNGSKNIFMLRSYTSSGLEEFNKTYDAGTNAYGTSLVVDSRGIVYTGLIADTGSGADGAVHKYAFKVNNLDPTLGLKVDAIPGVEVDLETDGYGGAFEATLTNGNDVPIAQFDMGLSGDVDWSTVTAQREGLKAFVHFGLGFSSTPGVNASTFSLLVPRPANASQVIICPGAIQLEDISDSCPGKEVKQLSDMDVDITTFHGQEYFKISGLTGTGGIPINDASAVRDTLTREQISIDSDHNVEFGTTLGIDSSGDTIELDFADEFDFSAITVDDIDLEVNTADEDLCTGSFPCAAAAGVWGVDLDAVNNILTFTAPTDANAATITISDVINVHIGLIADHQATGANQVTNPAAIGSYEVHIQITNGGVEVGELEIPIIDDDTVNVSGYIDTFITFDIDTSEIDEDCDAAGGSTPCDSHAGSSDNSGYVVDIGEMTISSVNVSGNSVAHQDGNTGLINFIWMDLSTNANGGAAVSVFSLNDALTGPGSSEIPSVGAGEVEITAGDGLYGLQNRFLDLKNAVSGDIIINDDCDTDGGNTYFCSVGGALGRELFNTNNDVVDQGRIQFRVGASPDALDQTGIYTDELTFIATATF